MSKNGGLVHAQAFCYECKWKVGTRNALGLAAIHSKKTGHKTYAETGHSYIFEGKE